MRLSDGELPQTGYGREKGFESVYFMNVKMTEEQLKTTVGKLMNDRECGEVFRVKVFAEGGWKLDTAECNA